MATATRRLPGVRVDAAPPPAAEALPRMDVAVLCGFAQTGPLHVPVPVESVTQYAAVFGPDAPLAWDETHAQRVRAYLGPAVRAFFANGGRRCWVIRVARTAATEALRPPSLPAPAVATANVFALPGVLALGAAGIEPATAAARCEGSWSDALRVAAALGRPGFGIEVTGGMDSPPSARFGFRTRFGLRAGDVVELEDAGAVTYATVDAVRAARAPGGPYEVEATAFASFERVGADGSPLAATVGTAEVVGFGPAVGAELTAPAEDDEAGLATLRFDAPMPVALEAGHWARWTSGGETVWLRMDALDRAPAFDGSPPRIEEQMVTAVATGPAWRELQPAAPLPGGVTRASLLTLDLRVMGGARAAHLTGIGLTPLHPTGWWEHAADADFYPSQDAAGPDGAGLPSDVERFPLARAAGAAPFAWIPLGVEPLFGVGVAPLPQAGTPLERDGLAAFGAELFLDPELAAASVQTLPELADGIRFLRTHTRPLLGVHAALSIGRGGLFNEASLLAIPDAVHLGWTRRPIEEPPAPEPRISNPPAHWSTHRGPCAAPTSGLEGPDFGGFLDCGTRVLAPPVLEEREAPVPPGAYRLRWTDSEPGGAYTLVEATRTDFGDAREVYRGPDPEYTALNQREGVYYYQAFAHRGDDRSAGSNAVAVRVRGEEWVQTRPEALDDGMEGEWLAIHRAALRLAAAGGDLFAALAMPRHFRTEQALRYAQRLRAVNEPPFGAEPGAFGYSEARAPSYGALYFPWLQSDARLPAPGATASASPGPVPTVRTPSLADLPPTVVPPDGAALGVLAARASQRGAWVAPANQPLRDVVALTPPVPATHWQRLQDAQVNVLRQDPRGFMTLSADTLSNEGELREINVRRLLTLLRRMALRRGHSYVFEPHGPVLRRAVQRGFDLLLEDLFRRGAFVGATPAQGFRVVTDDTVNTPQGVDAGRMVVELRVAPSVPLSFISVRLAQSGARLTVSEEL